LSGEWATSKPAYGRVELGDTHFEPGIRVGDREPARIVQCRAIGMSGQRLRTSPNTHSICIGVAQPIVSASAKYFMTAPASSAIAPES
jgi:hypothetical protein